MNQTISRKELKIYLRFKGDEREFRESASEIELSMFTREKFSNIQTLIDNEVPILTNHASLEHIHHQQSQREKFLVNPRRDKYLLKRIARKLHIQQGSSYTFGDFFGELLDLSWLTRM